jgi:hypothetical protein
VIGGAHGGPSGAMVANSPYECNRGARGPTPRAFRAGPEVEAAGFEPSMGGLTDHDGHQPAPNLDTDHAARERRQVFTRRRNDRTSEPNVAFDLFSVEALRNSLIRAETREVHRSCRISGYGIAGRRAGATAGHDS